jgi:hypothetical protein
MNKLSRFWRLMLFGALFYLEGMGYLRIPCHYAQQPQAHDVTHTEPLDARNVTLTNGVAPGYWPTAGSGTTLNLSAGTAYCGNAVITYAGGTLTMAGATNYVYLNTASSCVPATNTSGFSSTTIPISEVTVSAGAITAITDVRTMFFPPGTGSITQSKTCSMIFGSNNSSGSALATADIQPQHSECDISQDWTVTTVIVYVDAGASTVQVGYRNNGSTTAISPVLTPATVSGITDPVACANTGGTAITLQGHSVTCSTLSNTALTAGDAIETIGGAADTTSKKMSVFTRITVN